MVRPVAGGLRVGSGLCDSPSWQFRFPQPGLHSQGIVQDGFGHFLVLLAHIERQQAPGRETEIVQRLPDLPAQDVAQRTSAARGIQREMTHARELDFLTFAFR